MNEQEQKQLRQRILTELQALDDIDDFEITTGDYTVRVGFRGIAEPQDVYAALNFNPAIERPKSCVLKVHKRKALS